MKQKTRRTLEDLNWYISTPKDNETDSELHKVSGDPESETSNISDFSDMAATPTTSKSLTENEESPPGQQISNMDNNKCRSWQQSEEQNGNNSVDIVTNRSATENTEYVSNIGETSHFSRTESSTIPVIPVSDPSTWRLLTKIQKEAIMRVGTPENPKCFPRDSSGRCFPKTFQKASFFFKTCPIVRK